MTDQAQTKKTGEAVARLPLPEEAKPVQKPKNLRLLEGLLEAPVPAPAETSSPAIEVEPQAAKPSRGWASRLRPRHIAIISGFLGLVALPAVLTSLYMAFIAADQYHSSSSFSVRSIESSQPADILGMFSQASSGSTFSDSYVLLDFIRSERMVQAVDEAFGLDSVFAPRGLDYFYGIGQDRPIEDKLEYWRSMISVNFDHTSGIMELEVKAFTPEDSQKIAAFVIAQSEKLVNELSLSARNEVLKVAQSEVRMAEERLSNARMALRIYRDSSQEADPVEGAKLATQLVASLEQQLVQLKTELSTALTQMGENTPRVRVMRSQIASLEKQIEQERQRFGSGSASKQGRMASAAFTDVAGRIQQYETLETDREFAERAYTSALAGLEKARIEANAKQRYLAVFIQPTLSELAQYPSRILNSILVFLGALLAWGVVVMGYYNIRDRN
ncbi:RkpR, polysaccharide export protein [Neorhizobium petrolearium]|uniref:RkpR, polysaccharide export protein n=1 Tax=Neorhizobium petrolearium TaxID=515361 RepID=UPI003F176D70